jgi:thiamine-monophosphate kinase
VNEFDLIRKYFSEQPVHRPEVALGIGDDAAVVRVPAGQELVVTTDTLVAGVHFHPDADPAALGHKALAVNLSDLAAMGAEPAWFTLNITLPEARADWLAAFCEGLFGLAREHGVQLIGGNTARGPLNIAVEAHGLVPAGEALRRDGARAGDGIYVTGTFGDAALALKHRLGTVKLPFADFAVVATRLDRPTPRVIQGISFRGIAAAAIDVSDGLLADLGHLLDASKVGARIELERIPLSTVYRQQLDSVGWDPALSGGEDYELCFTVRPERTTALLEATEALDWGVRRIGEVVAQPGLRVVAADGRDYAPAVTGYDHFRS